MYFKCSIPNVFEILSDYCIYFRKISFFSIDPFGVLDNILDSLDTELSCKIFGFLHSHIWHENFTSFTKASYGVI